MKAVVIEGDNLIDCFEGLIREFGTNPEVIHNPFRGDHYLNLFNVVIQSNSSDHSGSLEDMGYSKSKMVHLLKSYIDPEKLWEWIDLIKESEDQFNSVNSDIVMRTTNRSKHTYGPCILSFSYRNFDNDPTLSIFSRSAELPQTFWADTLLFSALGTILKEELNKENLKINCFITSARMRSRAANFYSLYRIQNGGDYPHFDNEEFQKSIVRQWDTILADQGKKVSFSKLVKLQKEYHRIVNEKTPNSVSTTADDFVKRIRKGDWIK